MPVAPKQPRFPLTTTPEEVSSLIETMIRKFGHGPGQQVCVNKSLNYPDCVGVGSAVNFVPGANICCNCNKIKA